MSVGRSIAELRKRRDLTQAELASRVGVSQSYVARWENGHAEPRHSALQKIADALGVTVEELVLGERATFEQIIGVKDSELIELLQELPALNKKELEALKTMLRGLLSRSRMEQMLQR